MFKRITDMLSSKVLKLHSTGICLTVAVTMCTRGYSDEIKSEVLNITKTIIN